MVGVILSAVEFPVVVAGALVGTTTTSVATAPAVVVAPPVAVDVLLS